MHRTTEQYKKEALDAIIKHKLMRVSHIFGGFVSYTRMHFYRLELHNDPDIQAAILQNRTKATNYLIQKWIQSENPTLQIAAMRMVCDEEERQALAIKHVDHTTKGEKINDIDSIKKAFLESIKINDPAE
jgi:hypothetical protein